MDHRHRDKRMRNQRPEKEEMGNQADGQHRGTPCTPSKEQQLSFSCNFQQKSFLVIMQGKEPDLMMSGRRRRRWGYN